MIAADHFEKIAYLLIHDDEVAMGDAWLAPRERALQVTLRVASRRRAWRRGRWVAKRALGSWRRDTPMARLEILPAADGAPEAYENGRPLPVTLSISHRAGFAACALAPRACAMGFDLELIEARSTRFVRDYLTSGEQHLVAGTANEEAQAALICLIWSAKESALKAARTGLRRDTRTVEVSLVASELPDLLDASELSQGGASSSSGDAPVDSERGPLSWFPLEVLDRELNVRLGGYWARRGDLLLTFVSSPATSAPLEMGSALSDRGDRGDLRASKRGAF